MVELSQLDEELARAYADILSKTPDNEYIREWQRYWLFSLRDFCDDAPCLHTAYSSQIAELREHAGVLTKAAVLVSGLYERYYHGKLDADRATLLLLELKNHRIRLIGDAF